MRFNKAALINIRETALDTEHWRQLDKFISKRVNLPKDSPELLKELKDADCILVGFDTPVSAEMIAASPNLKYIGVLATAYGSVDIEAAKKRGIPVSNLGGYSTESVAEFVIAVILENIRQLYEGRQRGLALNPSSDGIRAREIKGKVFGVVGLGNIGGRVAEIAKGFGANVRYFSKDRTNNIFQYQDIDALLPECDFISINLSQNSETTGFFNAERIDSLKSGAVIVNTAPMKLIDIDALAKRLAKGDITFIMDHLDEMEGGDTQKLSKFKNCIIYPPIAWLTDEAKMNRQEIFISNIEGFLSGKPSNIVNQ